ncbi:3-keto-disaccharide hydrolase [Roseivirga sp.]|uniref:3-keto-disaccharide hydrolase n=1 Tax=Roseivirga sp. TaxID=1964215 RepID=UPI003B51A270
MKKLTLTLTLLFFCAGLMAQITDPKATEVWDPVPRKVTPGKNGAPPSDAVVLFDGTNLNEWKSKGDGSAAAWKVENGYMEVTRGKGDIMTHKKFGDIQLHIEWSAPTEIVGEGQGRGNSGVFLQEKYEVQVLDSYESRTYSNGQAASLYKQSIPLVNATVAPGEWNVYDIIYRAPRFNEDGIKVSDGTVTVIHNGIVVQNNVALRGTTEYIGLPKNPAHGDGSIVLQDHGNPVRFRNIWVREL